MHRIVFAVVLLVPLAGCNLGTDPCSEGPGVDNWIAGAERWLLLEPSALEDAHPDETQTATVRVQAAPVTDADHHGAFVTTIVAIHGVLLHGVQGALEEGGTVWLALATEGGRRERAIYVVARDPDGTFRLPGDGCGSAEFLRQRLGASFDERMEAIVGLTDPRQIGQLLQSPD